MKLKKKYYILLIGAISLISLWIVISSFGVNLACLAIDGFPKDYDTTEILIYNYRSTMVGRYDIVIYGDGSAYYLNNILKEDDSKPEAKFGVLSQEKLEEIINLFKKNNFLCLNENYRPLIFMTDMGTDYISFTIDGSTKRVEDYGRSSPSSFKIIVDELKNSVENLPQVNANDSDKLCNAIMNEFTKIPNHSDWTDWCLRQVNASIK